MVKVNLRQVGAHGEDDEDRFEFLNELDSAEIAVSSWEADFIESMMKQHEQERPLSDKQRETIDKIKSKYEDQL